MVDLQSLHFRIKEEIDAAILKVIHSSEFIRGPEVKRFEENLSAFMGGVRVVTCGNGTDALQLAMMGLGLRPGDEVITPAFAYAATVEVILLLGLKPTLVDIDERTFNLDVKQVREKMNAMTKAIVPVHLFGQCADVRGLLNATAGTGIEIIEDAAQALGAEYSIWDGTVHHAGTMGRLGTTSFFPTKTIGCLGDGGAVFTKDLALAEKIQMIANHGQRKKYSHELIGINSRLDTLHAAILEVKLRHIEDLTRRRQRAAGMYDQQLSGIPSLKLPHRDIHSTHVFHQYTIIAEDRDRLKEHLSRAGVPTMIYYPIPLHLQVAYRQPDIGVGSFPVAERIAKSVISLPIHTEIEEDQIDFICGQIRAFYHG